MIAIATTNAIDPIIIAMILPVDSFLFSPSAEMMILLALFPNDIDDGSADFPEEVVAPAVVCSEGVLRLTLVVVLKLVEAGGEMVMKVVSLI